MTTSFLRITLVLTFVLLAGLASGQVKIDSLKSGDQVVVKMQSGDEFNGAFVRTEGDKLVILTTNGEFSLVLASVRSITFSEYSGKYSFANPSDTRYFFGPSGIPLDQGKGYYQNVLLTLNFVNYGLTKNFSIGGGFEFISTLVVGEPVWFLTPKLGFKLGEKSHVGTGVFMMGFVGETANIGYSVYTYGTSDSNVSAGLGFAFANGGASAPVVVLSGMQRIGRSLMLLSENYVTDGYLGIQGFRIISRKTSFDIGSFISGYGGAFPYAGVIVVF
jgi:hypothetical protein